MITGAPLQLVGVGPAIAETTATPATRPRRDWLSWILSTRWHGLWIGLWSLVGWIATLLSPTLLDHPFLLMLLAPRALFVALAADSVNVVLFVLLGTLRLGVTDASYFILGKRFPRMTARPVLPTATRFQRMRSTIARWGERLCASICDHNAKAAAVLFFRPNSKYLAVAGAYNVPARVAGLSSVIGTAVYLASFHYGIGLLF